MFQGTTGNITFVPVDSEITFNRIPVPFNPYSRIESFILLDFITKINKKQSVRFPNRLNYIVK